MRVPVGWNTRVLAINYRERNFSNESTDLQVGGGRFVFLHVNKTKMKANETQ
jgi:hypothetical protein